MARKHKQTDHRGEAHANATSKANQAQTSDSTGTKRALPVDADKSQERSAKRSKADMTLPEKPTGRPRQTTKGQKAMATPDGSVEGKPNCLAQHPANNKRLRDEEDMEEISQKLSKRSRVNGNAGLNHVPRSQTTAIEHLNTSVTATVSAPDLAPVAEDQVLLPELQHLASQYDFSTMSILSSAKIESRVRNLLERIQSFSFANTKAKPGIVALRAKADVASKLCSVIELAKQQIEKEKGKWWQYNKLHGELLELKPKRIEPSKGGKTLPGWAKVQAPEEITCPKAANETEKDSITGEIREAMDEEAKEGSTMGQKGGSADEEEHEKEESFEVMTDPKLRDREWMQPQSGNGKKVMNTPIMTIIFAMVPVPGLKELYG